MKRLAALALALGLIVLAGAAWVVHALRAPTTTTMGATLPREDLPHAPDGVRIRVQVLNTTGKHGLARRATQLLRDRGYDVVETGNDPASLDTTVVLDRSGHADWAADIARVLRPAKSRTQRDSSRYLDVTVLLGRSWSPPSEPFNP